MSEQILSIFLAIFVQAGTLVIVELVVPFFFIFLAVIGCIYQSFQGEYVKEERDWSASMHD